MLLRIAILSHIHIKFPLKFGDWWLIEKQQQNAVKNPGHTSFRQRAQADRRERNATWLWKLAGLQTRFYFLTSRRMNFSRSPVNPAETLVGGWAHHTHPDTPPLHLSARLVHGDHGVSFHFIPGATRASLSVPPNHQGNITAATFPPTVLQGSTFKSCMTSNQQIKSLQIHTFSSNHNP